MTKTTVKELRATLKKLNVAFPAKAKKAELEVILGRATLTAAPKKAERTYKNEAHQKQAATMKTTMQVEDRSVVNMETGETFPNCNQAFKAGRLSSAVCDRVSGVLMKALRDGDTPPVVKTREHGSWTLASAWDGNKA